MNKQLEKQLCSFICEMKCQQLRNILSFISSSTGIPFQESTLDRMKKCFQTKLQYDRFTANGHGRNQDESFCNAAKNLLETFVNQNYEYEILLKAVTKAKNRLPKQENRYYEDTIDLTRIDLNEISGIDLNALQCRENNGKQQSESCSCIFYSFYKDHQEEVKNLKARMKLMSEENDILRSIIIKDSTNTARKDSKSSITVPQNLECLNKENNHALANRSSSGSAYINK